MSVLLVCEDPAEAKRVEEELAGSPESPFILQRVPNLDGAVDELRRAPYDSLVLDIPLPEQGAVNTLMRAQSLAHRIPIVVLGGSSDAELVLRAVEGGIQDVLVSASGRTTPPPGW